MSCAAGGWVRSATPSRRPDRPPSLHDLFFRRLGRDDFPRLVRWQAEPHVARWWGDAPDLETIAARYAPCVDGSSPTQVFIVEHAGRPIGLIQRYLVRDYPRWAG